MKSAKEMLEQTLEKRLKKSVFFNQLLEKLVDTSVDNTFICVSRNEYNEYKYDFEKLLTLKDYVFQVDHKHTDVIYSIYWDE